MPRDRVVTARIAACLLPVLLFAIACSDEDDPGGDGGEPETMSVSLDGALTDVQLIAEQPAEFHLTLPLPPEVGRLESVTVDLAATLENVQVNGGSLVSLLARRLTGRAPQGEATATGYIRVGSDPATVCSEGIAYGPFQFESGGMTVTPDSAVADAPTLAVINAGSISFCLGVTSSVDARVSLDRVELEVVPADCPAPANFAGTWSGTYSCGNSCGEPFGGDITLVVTQSGSSASYTDDGGDHYTGTVCGNQFRFERRDGLEIETGTLTLQPDGSAVKHSTWRYGQPAYCRGNCTDHLTRD